MTYAIQMMLHINNARHEHGNVCSEFLASKVCRKSDSSQYLTSCRENVERSTCSLYFILLTPLWNFTSYDLLETFKQNDVLVSKLASKNHMCGYAKDAYTH